MLTLGPRSSWIQSAVALAVLALLMQTGYDWLVRAAIWTAVVAASIYIVVRAFLSAEYLVAAGIALIGAWFLWQIWNIVKRNRPRRYAPDAIPADVLPS